MAAAAQIQLRSPATGSSASEFDLLCACCRVSDGAARLDKLIHDRLDWDNVLKLASFHRVLPAVYHALKARPDVPVSILSALEARFTSHLKRVLRFSAELAGISRQFEKAGIDALCQKGPALAQRLYGDPAAREFGDLDFLVRPSGVSRAREALIELGFAPQLTLVRRQEREYLRSGYEYVFGSATEPNLIELQWQILPRFYGVDFDTDSLFRRSIVVDCEGLRLRGSSDEDLMLSLCVHAAKHGWSQLGMVRDIAAVAKLGIDWAWTAEEARRLGIFNVLAISLELAHKFFGMPLPKEIAGYSSSAGDSNVPLIQQRMSRAEEVQAGSLQYFRMMINMRERRRDRMKFAWRLATTPTLGEWQAVNLPDSLFPFYYGIRASRLAARVFRRLTSSSR